MNKIEVLRRLRAAKRSHLQWISNARGMVDGIPVNPKSVPTGAKQSGFGQWYYGEGQNLSDFDVFTQIAPHHQKMHEVFKMIAQYMRGYETTEKTSSWKNLLGKKESKHAPEPEKALQLYPSLKRLSDEVTRLMRELEEQINNLP